MTKKAKSKYNRYRLIKALKISNRGTASKTQHHSYTYNRLAFFPNLYAPSIPVANAFSIPHGYIDVHERNILEPNPHA